jgi:hypothetical protein
MSQSFKNIFDNSSVKVTIESIFNKYLTDNSDYKKLNIEIGLFYGLTDYTIIKANIKSEGVNYFNEIRPLTALLSSYNIISEIKKLIKENNLNNLDNYELLLSHSSEK